MCVARLSNNKQVAADQLPNMARMRDQLIDRVSRIKGAAVEDNIFSVSVHYRNCHPSDVQQVGREAGALVRPHSPWQT